MKKLGIIIVLVILLFSACTINKVRTNRIYEHIASEGFNDLTYNFSDNGNRNLKIKFYGDSTLLLTNVTSISQTYYALSFKCTYSFKQLNIGSLYISNKISCDKKLSKTKYLKPYDNQQYTINENAIDYIFPDIQGDTIRFSSDFKRLQIKEFCFELK